MVDAHNFKLWRMRIFFENMVNAQNFRLWRMRISLNYGECANHDYCSLKMFIKEHIVKDC